MSVPRQGSVRPGSDAPANTCQFRLTGAILAVEETSDNATPTYQMRYLIQSAEAIISPAGVDDCRPIASSYISDVSSDERTLFLTWAADGALIDSISGTQYTRASQ